MEQQEKEPLTLREKLEAAVAYAIVAPFIAVIMMFVGEARNTSIGPAAFRVSPELLHKLSLAAIPIALVITGVLWFASERCAPSKKKGYAAVQMGNAQQRPATFSALIAALTLGYTGNLLYGLIAFVAALIILKRIPFFNPPIGSDVIVNDPELTKEFDELGLTVLGEATPIYDTVGDGVFDGLRTRLTRSDQIWDNTEEPYYLYTVQVENSIKDLRIVIRKTHSEAKIPKQLNTVTSSYTVQLNDVTVLSDNPSAASQWIADNIQAINALMDWAEFLALNVEPERYARDEFFEGEGLLTLDQDSTKPDTNPDLRGIISQLVNFSKGTNR